MFGSSLNNILLVEGAEFFTKYAIKIFHQFCHLVKILSSCVNNCIEEMVTITSMMKFLSVYYSSSTKVPGLGENFSREILLLYSKINSSV